MSAEKNLRDWEAARIARWFRETEYGLVFYDAKGRAQPIAERERQGWTSQALKQLDRYMIQHRKELLETILIAILLFASASAAAAIFGERIPMLRQYAPAMALTASLWPMLSFWQFRRRQAALRRRIAERLRMRTPLPEAAAAAHRRFNIFALGQLAAVAAIAFIGAAAVFRGDPESPGFFYLPILALVAVAWPLHWAARKVDANHRRMLR